MVTVKYTSRLRVDLGRESDRVQAGTVAELVSQLEKRHGQAFIGLRRLFRIFVNGQSIEPNQGYQTPLADGDEVVFLLPVAGG